MREEVDRGQRELFLREQMRVIQHELGEADVFQQELLELRERIAGLALPDAVREKAEKELARLELIPPMAPEVGIIRTYLDWLLDLPWQKTTEDNLDLRNAAEVLDAEHYGLPKAKDRILEHMAVRKLAPDKMRSPILCFVGPPGTGKTSLGKSIAKALGRELCGQPGRRARRGRDPGPPPDASARCRDVSSRRCVARARSTPCSCWTRSTSSAWTSGRSAAALLEVLDPEQNAQYSDHYLEVDYDLSKVFFITTANYLTPSRPRCSTVWR